MQRKTNSHGSKNTLAFETTTDKTPLLGRDEKKPKPTIMGAGREICVGVGAGVAMALVLVVGVIGLVRSGVSKDNGTATVNRQQAAQNDWSEFGDNDQTRVVRDEIGVGLIVDNTNYANDLEVAADTTIVPLPPTMTDGIRQLILDEHNRFRGITARGETPGQPPASGMNKLLWDPVLEKVATDYSKLCIWAHSKVATKQYKETPGKPFNYTDEYVGENLFFTKGGQYFSVNRLLNGIKAFYNEYKYYNFTTRGCSKKPCGHYTQLVQDVVRYVGCGINNCGQSSLGLFLVCNYVADRFYPARPYIEGPACSACPADRTKCDNGLCSGCPSAAYYQCSLQRRSPSKCEGWKKTHNICSWRYCKNSDWNYRKWCVSDCLVTCNICQAPPAELVSPTCCPPLNPTAPCKS